MKLWQKNYLVTALLFTGVLFACVAVLVISSARINAARLRDGAISEEKAIAGALENMVLHSETPKEAVVRGIARQYEQNGTYLMIRHAETEWVNLLPFEDTVPAGTLQWSARDGRVYISIGEAFRDEYEMTFQKDVTEQTTAMVQSILAAVGLCMLLSIAVDTILYYTMLRINQPLSRLSHELRTPLTVVRGYGELLKLAALSDEQRYDAASYVVEECDRMKDIIQKILTMNDKGHIDRERISIADLKQHLSMTWEDVAIETKGESVYGDQTLLISLLDNLIGNAKKAGGAVTVCLSPQEFSVTDTGRGMDEKTLAYVNDPAHTARPNDIRSGLGVPLCYEIAKKHDAVLHYASRAGEGTTATLRFYNSDTTL